MGPPLRPLDDPLADYTPDWRQRLGDKDPVEKDPLADYTPDWRAQAGDLDPEEARFYAWYAPRAAKLGLDANPDAPEHFYDYRAAFKAGAEPNAAGHWPDAFKMLGHPTQFLGLGRGDLLPEPPGRGPLLPGVEYKPLAAAEPADVVLAAKPTLPIQTPAPTVSSAAGPSPIPPEFAQEDQRRAIEQGPLPLPAGRPSEIRAAPEPSVAERFGSALATTAAENFNLGEAPIQSPRRVEERTAARAAAGNLKLEPGDQERDLATQVGQFLGGLVDPTAVLPFVGGEKVAMSLIESAAQRGIPFAKQFVELATAPETASLARLVLASATRAVGTAGAGTVAAETAQKLGTEGRLPTPGEAGSAFAAGTLLAPVAAAGGTVLGAIPGVQAVGRAFSDALTSILTRSTGTELLAPKDVVQAATDARAAKATVQGGRLSAEQEAAYAAQVLGVTPDATDAEISIALRQRAAPYHPEGATPDEELFKVFSEAASTLRQRARAQAAAPHPTPAEDEYPQADVAETAPTPSVAPEARRDAEIDAAYAKYGPRSAEPDHVKFMAETARILEKYGDRRQEATGAPETGERRQVSPDADAMAAEVAAALEQQRVAREPRPTPPVPGEPVGGLPSDITTPEQLQALGDEIIARAKQRETAKPAAPATDAEAQRAADREANRRRYITERQAKGGPDEIDLLKDSTHLAAVAANFQRFTDELASGQTLVNPSGKSKKTRPITDAERQNLTALVEQNRQRAHEIIADYRESFGDEATQAMLDKAGFPQDWESRLAPREPPPAPSEPVSAPPAGGRPVEEVRAEAAAREQQVRSQDIVQKEAPALARDERIAAPENEDYRGEESDYRDRIDAALESGRAADARALYTEATKLDEDQYHKVFTPDAALEKRIQTAETEAKTQTDMFAVPAAPGEPVAQPPAAAPKKPTKKEQFLEHIKKVQADAREAEQRQQQAEADAQAAATPAATPVDFREGTRPEDIINGTPGWELTPLQFQGDRAMQQTGQRRVLNARDRQLHQDIVKRAVERGENVPDDVLRSYQHEPWARSALERSHAERTSTTETPVPEAAPAAVAPPPVPGEPVAVPPAVAPPAKGGKFALWTPNGMREVEAAKALPKDAIPGFEEFDFTISKGLPGGDKWVVTENKTRRRLGGGDTQATAIESANRHLGLAGIDLTRKAVSQQTLTPEQLGGSEAPTPKQPKGVAPTKPTAKVEEGVAHAETGPEAGALEPATSGEPTAERPGQVESTGAGGETPGAPEPRRVRGERHEGPRAGGVEGETLGVERPEERDVGEAGGGTGVERPGPRAEPQGPKGESGRLRGLDYRITDADALGEGGPVTKIRANLRALELLKQIENEGRLATAAEQAELVKYVGWGAFPRLFDPNPGDWAAHATRLRELLNDQEWDAARHSTINAHYTSPDIIRGIYDALERLGFTGGRILEPSMGIGHFFGLMPGEMKGHSKLMGIELDSVTGRIAKLLYPNADIRVNGFEHVKIADNTKDVAVSNVPFGKVQPFDPKYNKLKLSIHNYFFAKALDAVRPGGIVAFVTSRYTMDQADPKVREYLAERANLLGAIRLPNTAFKENAGTEVTTDVIFLQKREPGQPAGGEAFLDTKEVQPGLRYNDYFVRHPEMMLGTMELVGTMRAAGEPALIAPKDQDIATAFREAASRLPENVYQPDAGKAAEQETVQREKAEGAQDGMFVDRSGTIQVAIGGEWYDAKVPKAHYQRVSALLKIRDAVRSVILAQLEEASDEKLKALQQEMGRLYDRFVKQHGPINKEEVVSSAAEADDEIEADEEGDEAVNERPIVRVKRPNIKYFDDDLYAPLVLSLEKYNPENGTATKADIFTQRTVRPPKVVTHVESANDAMLVSLDNKGAVDLDYMETLTGKSRSQVLDELKTLVYDDPETGIYEPADEYLSGNVRKKLALAKDAAARDPRYHAHVEALTKALPKDKLPSEIRVALGATWIPEADVQQFVEYLLRGGDRWGKVTVGHFAKDATWALGVPAEWNETVASRQEWGTQRVPASKLIEQALNQELPVVYDEGPDRTRVKNQAATLEARDKQQQIQAKFQDWLFSDPERQSRLVKKYNEEMNNIRNRKYDGSHLTFPGASMVITPHPHQRNLVHRVLSRGVTLAAHVVGSGKTYSMIMAGMESRRLGFAKKPMYAVPNHMLHQFKREFLEMYPAAKILVATKKDFDKKNRRLFMAKITNNSWDAVVLTHSSFGKIPMSRTFQESYLRGRMQEYEDLLRTARENEGTGRNAKRGSIVKDIEAARDRLSTKLQTLINRAAKDETLMFEETGVDMLFVDESHKFKNLEIVSGVQGMSSAGSQRSMDLYMKTQYLHRINPGRGVVFASGTPISNTLAEAYTVQRYLQPDLLAEHGMESFDGWSANFIDWETKVEFKPEGGGFQTKTRPSQFRNLRELSPMFREVADVVSQTDAKLSIPTIRGGKPTDVIIPPSPELLDFLQSLAARAEYARGRKPEKGEDNMLTITNDGRKAALDMRLISEKYGAIPNSKVEVAADRIAQIYKDTAAKRSTQMVFSDLGPPGGVGFNVYDALKQALVERGVAPKDVAFMHDAKTDLAKDELFRAVRAGRIRVLIGSTQKMGEGTNVQQKMVALHHLDSPWKPAEIEQRDGRIVRQGNENPEVQIYRYQTEKSFDAYMWQLLERKARFIDRFMKADGELDRIEDVDGRALSYAEAKALITGDPKIMEKAGVDAEVERLKRQKASFADRQYQVRQQMLNLPIQLEARERNAAKNRADAADAQDVTGDKFSIEIAGTTYTKRADAAKALWQALGKIRQIDAPIQIGSFAGFPLAGQRIEHNDRSTADPERAVAILRGELEHPTTVFLLKGNQNFTADTPDGALRRLEIVAKNLPEDQKHYEAQVEKTKADIADAQRLMGEKFDKEDQLKTLVARQKELDDYFKQEAAKSASQSEAAQHARANPIEATQERIEELAQLRREHPDETEGQLLDRALQQFPSTRIGSAIVSKLIRQLGSLNVRTAGLNDAEIVQRALAHGLIDDVTISDIGRAIGLISNEGGFLKVPGLPSEPPTGSVPPPPDVPTDEPGHVYSERMPRQLGFVESWIMPVSRIGKRMLHSKDGAVQALGEQILSLQRAGRTAVLAMSRLTDEFDQRIKQALGPLKPKDRQVIMAALDKYETAPADWNDASKNAFNVLRDGFRHDWRRLGENERIMLSVAKRDLLDMAMDEWPEGGAEKPDFDNVPVNRQSILAAAKRKGLDASPKTADDWRQLYEDLKDLDARVQKPVFMDSPDLRRIFDMIQGRGGIMAYFPHVFMGDWVVRAGQYTKRFVDRLEAADYARGLLEDGKVKGDLWVQRDAFNSEFALYLSRKQYFRLQSALKAQIDQEGAVLSKATADAGIKMKPRRRWYAHQMARDVNLQTFEQDVLRALRIYSYRTAKKLAFDPFRKAALAISEDLPAEGGWREWADQYIADLQGVPHQWVERVNATLEMLTAGHVKPFALQRAASRWQKLMGSMMMGYSPITAITNTTQIGINIVPRFQKNGERWVTAGFRALGRHNAEDQAVLDRVGVKLLHPKYLAGEYLPRGFKIDDAAWYMPMGMFSKSEDLNRGVAALAKYYEQRAAGASVDDAIDAALEFTTDTNFDYSLADAPGLLRNPVGRALFQFKTFPINQIFFAEDLLRWGNASQRARFIAYLMAFGGLSVLTYGTPLWILNWLTGKTGWFEDENGVKQTAYDEFWDHVPNPGLAWQAAKYGLLALLGFDMSQRVGFGGPSEFDSTLPGSKMKEIAEALSSKNATERAGAMKQMLPVVVKRLLQAYEAAKEGKIRNRFGAVVDDDVSLGDLIGLALGVQTVERTEKLKRKERDVATLQQYGDRRSDYLDRATQALRANDGATLTATLREAKAHGITITVDQVKQHRKMEDLTDVQRRAVRTPKDLRKQLFAPDELQGIGGGRPHFGPPPPPRSPQPRRH